MSSYICHKSDRGLESIFCSFSIFVRIGMCLSVFVWACICVHISACAHSCYKYQRWLTVSSVWLWQLLFVVVDRLLVNGWRFEVPCLSPCDGYKALLWMWIPVHGAPLSAPMHSTYMAPTGSFSLNGHRLKGSWEDQTWLFFELLIYFCCC